LSEAGGLEGDVVMAVGVGGGRAGDLAREVDLLPGDVVSADQVAGKVDGGAGAGRAGGQGDDRGVDRVIEGDVGRVALPPGDGVGLGEGAGEGDAGAVAGRGGGEGDELAVVGVVGADDVEHCGIDDDEPVFPVGHRHAVDV